MIHFFPLIYTRFPGGANIIKVRNSIIVFMKKNVYILRFYLLFNKLLFLFYNLFKLLLFFCYFNRLPPFLILYPLSDHRLNV